MILSLANMLPLFYAPLFMSEYVYALYSTFTSEYVRAVLCYFLSSESVCTVHGTLTSEYVYAVLCYFSRANVFALFYWFFHERMRLRCFMLLFSRANVFSLFIFLSRANMFALFYVIFLEQLCLRYFMVLSRADMFTLFPGTL